MDDGDSPKQPDRSHYYDQPTRWQRFVAEIKRQSDEREAKKKSESAQDKAARRSALATIWIAIFTAVAIAVGVSQFFAMHNQQIIMEGQLEEMRAQQRAWLSINTTFHDSAGLRIAPDGGSMALDVSATNHGNVPALKARAISAIYAYPTGMPFRGKVPYESLDVCEQSPASELGVTIFPAETVPLGLQISTVSRKVLDAIGGKEGKVSLILEICVQYQSGSEQRTHSTNVWYSLTRSDKSMAWHFYFNTKFEAISSQRVQLQRFAGFEYAN